MKPKYNKKDDEILDAIKPRRKKRDDANQENLIEKIEKDLNLEAGVYDEY